MNSQLQRQRWLKSIAAGSSVLCMVAGGLVIVGWGFDIQSLKRISPEWVAMKANTAVGFMLGGLSLWLLRDETATSARRRLGQACAAVVCLLGLLTLGEYVFQADLGIDQLLFKDSPSAVEPALPGRMASASALCFVLVGLGLVGLNWTTRRGLRPAHALFLLVLFVGLTDFTAYLYDAKAHHPIVPFATMALHTALLFIVVSLGALCARPDQGPLGILIVEGAGSAMACRLLPLVVAAPVLLGWLGMAGRQAGFYTLEFGIALLATSSGFVISAVIWLTAVSMNRTGAERAQTEAARCASEERFHQLFESSPDAIVVTARSGAIQAVNGEADRMFGYLRAELVGQPIEILLPRRFAIHHAAAREAYAGNPRIRRMGEGRELFACRKDGSEFPVEVSLSPISTDKGTMVISTIRDITARAQSEVRLKGSEAQYRRLFEAAKDGILILNAETGMIEDVNPYLTELLGFTREQVLGQKVWELGFFKNLIASHEKFLELQRNEYVRYEDLPLEGADGRRIDAEFVSNVYEVNGTKVIQCNIRNITERKRKEEELRWKTALLEAQMDAALDGLLVVDPQGRKVLQNQRMIEVWKLPPEIAADPDDTRELNYAVSQTRNPEAFLAKVRHLYAHPDEISHDEIELKDGTVLDRYSSPVRGKDGRHYGRIWAFRDITEKKQLAAQFLRSQRMESLGSLAGGIAHDLNNALAPILMSAELLKLISKDPNPEAGRILNGIFTSAQRGAGMVKQILTFARGSEGERGVVQPKHLVQEMIDLTRHTFPAAIQIRTDVAPDIWTLQGNPTQLHQILLNLCVNARDAMPTGGTLTLAAGNVRLDDASAELPPDAPPGPYVMLSVTDTGTGMTPEVRARLFEAFFTTKEPGKGTGLGLATVHRIAKDHAGFLTVDSELGHGTTFKVYLPAQETATLAAAEAVRPALPMGHGELILVVDDEAAIRSIATQTLETYGYRVVTASDGAQAIAVCAKHLTELQLLLTDMAMPIMDGKATIRAVRTLLPRLPVVASSGSGSESSPPVLKELGVQAFLRKPFSADDLVRTVHEVLQEKVPS